MIIYIFILDYILWVCHRWVAIALFWLSSVTLTAGYKYSQWGEQIN